MSIRNLTISRSTAEALERLTERMQAAGLERANRAGAVDLVFNDLLTGQRRAARLLSE